MASVAEVKKGAEKQGVSKTQEGKGKKEKKELFAIKKRKIAPLIKIVEKKDKDGNIVKVETKIKVKPISEVEQIIRDRKAQIKKDRLKKLQEEKAKPKEPKAKKAKKEEKPLTKHAKKTNIIEQRKRVQARLHKTPLNRAFRIDRFRLKKKKPIVQREVKIRKSLTPGTVIIILHGVHIGKRVVLLKTTKSGALLVTGPRNVNGVPIRRYKQEFVIATSTKIDISSVKVDKLDDDLFPVKQKKFKRVKTEEQFFATDKNKKKDKKKVLSPKRRTAQAEVDKALEPIISKVPYLGKYLKARFTLVRGVYPHTVKF